MYIFVYICICIYINIDIFLYLYRSFEAAFYYYKQKKKNKEWMQHPLSSLQFTSCCIVWYSRKANIWQHSGGITRKGLLPIYQRHCPSGQHFNKQGQHSPTGSSSDQTLVRYQCGAINCQKKNNLNKQSAVCSMEIQIFLYTVCTSLPLLFFWGGASENQSYLKLRVLFLDVIV